MPHICHADACIVLGSRSSVLLRNTTFALRSGPASQYTKAKGGVTCSVSHYCTPDLSAEWLRAPSRHYWHIVYRYICNCIHLKIEICYVYVTEASPEVATRESGWREGQRTSSSGHRASRGTARPPGWCFCFGRFGGGMGTVTQQSSGTKEQGRYKPI